VNDNLTRIKDLAARARQMARWTLNRNDKSALINLAEKYDQEAAEIEARDKDAGG
jgi:hypothetical protein